MRTRSYQVNENEVINEMIGIADDIVKNIRDRDILSVYSNSLQLTRLKVYSGITTEYIETICSKAFYYITQKDKERTISELMGD